MKLKVFTLPSCPNCPATRKIAEEVAEEFGIGYREIDIGTPDGEIEGLMYQIMSTPSVAIDEEVIARGRLVPKEELENEVKKRLK